MDRRICASIRMRDTMIKIPALQKLFLITCLIAALSICADWRPAHAQSDRIVFAVIGDYGLAGQNEADVANLVKGWNPDFIVTVGDNNYPHGQSYSIDDNIGQYYHDYILGYKGKYGSSSPTKRFYPVLGNHDWGTTGGKPYFDFFNFYNQTTYYDFIQGPVHFFMLDSDQNEPDGTSATSDQAKWLKKSLAASTSAFNVIVFHHAPYSSGWHGPTNYMRWPFKEWGADAVLTGHDHIYERLLVNGLPYFINGIGGAELYKFDRILPESQARFNQDYGAMRVEANGTTMKFQMYTRTGLLVDEYTLGQGFPTVTSVTLANPSPTNADILNFQVVFSEAVTGVDAGDFSITSNTGVAAISNISGSGNTYIISANSGSGDGTVRLDVVDNDSIINAGGNSLGGPGIGNGNFVNGAMYVVNKSTPGVISINRTGTSPTNTATVDFMVTFSEPVTGVDLTDFVPVSSAGAQLSAIIGSGPVYTVTALTGIGNDSLRLDFIDNDSVSDEAGNRTGQGFSTGEIYSVDRTTPTVTSIVRGSSTSTTSVDYIVSFSEPVTGVDGSDFILSTMNNAIITNVFGSGSSYTVSITLQPGSDVLRLDLSDNDSIFDNVGNFLGGSGFGNGNMIGESIPIAIDTPIATSILRTSPNPSNAGTVDFIVTFSETVEGVDALDFMASGIPNAAILSVNSVNPFFIVTVSTGSGDGILRLDLLDDDSIHNLQGVALGGGGTGNGNFIAGETYTIDKTSPRATSIIRASPNPAIGSSVDFIITFSESVLGVDAADFIIATTNIDTAITNIQNVDPFYVVTVSTGAGSGLIRLDLINNSSITDRNGNPVAEPVVSGEAFTIAKIPVNFPPPFMTAINRINLTINNQPMLAWSAIRNARAYEVFLATDSNFTNIVAMQTVKALNFTPTSSLADGTYYARVWAYNFDLNPGRFSRTYSFTIDTTPPSPPTLIRPSNNLSTPKRPQLQWAAVGGVSQYQVEVDDAPDFSSPAFTEATRKTSSQTKALISGRTYYWRVKARDAAGNWSDWSPILLFHVP